MEHLLTFACLCMCTAALMGLLPESSGLRKTALLASGLLTAALWLQSLPGWLPGIRAMDAPSTWLTDADAPTVQSLLQQWEEKTHEQAANLAAP